MPPPAKFADLEKKVVLVNGGTRGIGKQVVHDFLANGSIVVFTGRDKNSGTSYEADLSKEFSNSQVAFHQVDSRDSPRIFDLVNTTVKRFHKIDILVNNAAVNFYSPFSETKEEKWDEIVRTNLGGYFYYLKHVVPHMNKAGKGTIVNVSSVIGYRGIPGRGIYSATKAAIDSLTRTIVAEYSKSNIRINSVCLGTIDTDMVRNTLAQSGDPAKEESKLKSRIPMGRFGESREVSNVVLFVASDLASYVNGAFIFVDGGWSAVS